MKLTTKLTLTLALVAGFVTTTYAGPSNWPPAYPTRVTTKAAAMACCVPKAHVALACKDCKTVNAKGGEDKKDILSWFAPDSTHGCSGCGGKITVSAGDKKGTIGAYKHVCSKCSKDSAYVCTDHKS